MLIGDVIPLWKIDEAWGRELNVRLNVWCRRRRRRGKRMLAALNLPIFNFLPESLESFKMYDIFHNSHCAQIVDFGGKLTCIDFKVLTGRGGFYTGPWERPMFCACKRAAFGQRWGQPESPPLLSGRLYVGPRAHCVFSGYFLIISPNVETHRVGGKCTMWLLYGYCQLSQIRLPVH